MRFEWSQYLTLAEELRQADENGTLYEARLRVAISRAYYAVFNTAKIYLHDKGVVVPPTGEAHTFVPAQLRAQSERHLQRVAIYLDRLRISRTQADYDLAFVGDVTKAAALAVVLARRAVMILDDA